MIKKVTITGADNSISPSLLTELQKEFPFVEWGILVSRKQFGNNRFPSKEWIDSLLQESGLNLSVHLCGAYVREFLMGDFKFKQEIPSLFEAAKRIQINTHGEPHTTKLNEIVAFMAMWPSKQFIFQYDDANTTFIDNVLADTYNGAALFDLSHGAGLLPSQWPKPLEGVKCGYAGGLSPDNIESQIEKIESIVGDTEIWIDMETHVRSNMDALFDFVKVRKCLEISSCAVGV